MDYNENTDYYVVSSEYEGLPLMARVNQFGGYFDDCFFYVWKDDKGEWLWSGNIKPHHLLTAEQIVKLYEEHLMLADAFERHG